jgi:hypothetical protein
MTLETKIDRPIEGDIVRRRPRPEQLGAKEFLAAIDSLFAFAFVEAVGWTQYTPYFNDGEPCEFGIHEVGVKIAGVGPDLEDEDAYGLPQGFFTTYGLFRHGDKYRNPNWHEFTFGKVRGTPEYNMATEAYQKASQLYFSDENKVFEIAGHDTKDVYETLRSINWGQFENVMEDNFGDHAVVIATREGFEVEFFDHD